MKNKGFTLMEVIVVVAIIVILLGIAAIGANSYLENADINERESVAETTYLAFQEYLTSLKKTGNLEAFNKSINKSGNVKKLNIEGSELQSILQNHYSGNYASYYSIFKENHEDCDIVSVVFSNGKKEHPLYNVLLNSLGDTDKLNNAFAIEYNQTTGVVMSVFYSKEVEAFSFDSMYGGDYMAFNNIIKRDEDSIISKKQGYYGVYNTSNKGEAIPESFYQDIKATINNDDRLYICFDDESIYSGKADEADISYLIELYTKNGSGAPFSTMTVSRKDMKGFNDTDVSSNMLDYIDPVGSKSIVNAVYKSTYDTLGNNIDHVLILLDCIHTNNFQNVFREKMKIVDGITEPEKCEIFANVSILINGAISGSAVTETTNPVFEKYDEANDVYTISCTRHLNNIRYFSDKNNYLLTDNINMKQFEREENDKNDASLDETDRVNRHWYSEFEPITFKDLAGNTVTAFSGTFFGYKDESVELNSTKEECYSIKGLTINKESDNVGLFHTVKSVGDQCRVGALTFLDSKIEGKKNVGILCGESATPLTGIYIEDSYITGLGYIGGIVGKASGTISKCAASGNLYVESTDRTALYDVAKKDKVYTCLGGLIGYTTGTIENCNINSPLGNINYYEDEDYLYGNAIGGIAGVSEGAIKDCEVIISKINGYNNAGGIVGIPYCDLTNCDVTFESMDVAGYSGGLCGTAYSCITINNCVVNSGTLNVYYYDSESKYCGGIIGTIANKLNPDSEVKERITNSGFLLIKNCTNKANIEINEIKNGKYASNKPVVGSIGGITAGNQDEDEYGSSEFYNSTIEISKCINKGNIICDKECYLQVANVGGVVGVISKKTTIRECNNEGKISSKVGIKNVGGIIGYQYASSNNSIISNCINYGKIITNSSMENVAGIVGYSWSLVYIYDCINDKLGSIECDGICQNVAGIVGSIVKGITIDNSQNDADIDVIKLTYHQDTNSGIAVCVGGIVGNIKNEAIELSVVSCSNKGKINIGSVDNGFVQYIGGIIGYDASVYGDAFDTVNIFESIYNDGELSVLSDAKYIGGFAGYISSDFKLGVSDDDKSGFTNNQNAVIKCMAVSDGSYIGGVVGSTTGKGTIYYSVNNAAINIIKGKYIGGIIGYDHGSEIYATSNNGDINANGDVNYVGGIIGVEMYQGTVLGMFGNADMACKNNANISVVDGAAKYVGGFIGYLCAETSIYNCTCNGSIYADAKYMGGALGCVGTSSSNDFNVEIDDCSINGEIVTNKYEGNTEKSDYIGGLIGYCVLKELILQNCEVKNPITINNDCAYVGGLIGILSGTLDCSENNSINNDIVINNSEKALYISQVIGCITSEQEIWNLCVNSKLTVAKGANFIGGLVGYVSNDITTIEVTYEGEIVLGADSKYVGGLVGYQDSGEYGVNCDTINSTLNLTCDGTLDYAGGVVGYAAQSVYIWGNEVNTNIETKSSSSRIGGVVGVTNECSDVYEVTFSGGVNIGGTGEGVSLLIGSSNLNFTVWDTSVKGDIYISDNCENVGAFIGKANSNLEIGNCAYNGNMICEKDAVSVSAIIGQGTNANIGNILVESDIDINANAERIGLLSGYCKGTITMIGNDESDWIKGDKFIGHINIKGQGSNIGGIVGQCSKTLMLGKDLASLPIEYKGDISVGSGNCVGGVAGSAYGGTQYNVKVKGNITAGTKSQKIGGLYGYINNNEIIYASERIGDIILNSGENEFISGGFGQTLYSTNANGLNIEGSIICKNDATVTYVGGIIGGVENKDGYKTQITDASFNGNINSISSYGGGFVGRSLGTYLYITDSVAGSDETDSKLVVKGDRCGGLAGYHDNVSSYIKFNGCVNYLDICCESSNSNSIGGIIGEIKTAPKSLQMCGSTNNKYTINYGDITANGNLSDAGGIIGKLEDKFNANHCQSLGDIEADTMQYVGSIGGYCKTDKGKRVGDKSGTFALYSDSNIKARSGGSSYVGGLFGSLTGAVESYSSALYNAYYTGKIDVPNGSNIGRVSGYREMNYCDVYTTYTDYPDVGSGRYKNWDSTIYSSDNCLTDTTINSLKNAFGINYSSDIQREIILLLVDYWSNKNGYSSSIQNNEEDENNQEEEEKDEMIDSIIILDTLDEESEDSPDGKNDDSEDDSSELNDISENDINKTSE